MHLTHLLLSFCSVASTMAAITPRQTPPNAKCLLDAGLGEVVLVRGDPQYAEREASYWSNSAKLGPAAILRPRNAKEVAIAVKALAAARQPFAVRSGGHTNWAGSNNIADGITIDLGLFNTTTYNAATETADIGPGSRWRDVYSELIKHKRAVAGGREGNVGVAGLLLGGGNTFFTARRGFACDNVVAYEVVLADGRIVTASKTSNPDLFLALKGGSNNFGIVTKFTMTAIPSDKVWGGMAFLPKDIAPQAVDAVVSFTNNVANDPDSNLVAMFTHMPDFKDIVVATLYANMAGIEKPAAYNQWLALPEIMTTVKNTTISEMAFEYNIPANLHDIWFTLSLKNDARILNKAAELHVKLVEDLKAFIPEQTFTTQCLFQPLPTVFGKNSVAAGGNVMGVERQKSNGVLLLATAMVETAEQEKKAYPLVKTWVEEVKKFAATIDGGLQEWTYLNYADKSQNPLGSYGSENIRKMKATAAKYDPQGVFQKLVPGGFKISKI
ncbi:hypothetical protein QBC40DRAFT_313788 [Triangularia verruculosa]|uniref:FAD-binding PCMH-type domain-containing protein n=1 Tax=Triangularia verruculosa TaxID=2587418 RepID=A0AAN7ARD0_9PEZI|nr:hypothetical protein QBC40DRAFT_313788 [Triangularia verruculosa]